MLTATTLRMRLSLVMYNDLRIKIQLGILRRYVNVVSSFSFVGADKFVSFDSLKFAATRYGFRHSTRASSA